MKSLRFGSPLASCLSRGLAIMVLWTLSSCSGSLDNGYDPIVFECGEASKASGPIVKILGVDGSPLNLKDGARLVAQSVAPQGNISSLRVSPLGCLFLGNAPVSHIQARLFDSQAAVWAPSKSTESSSSGHVVKVTLKEDRLLASCGSFADGKLLTPQETAFKPLSELGGELAPQELSSLRIQVGEGAGNKSSVLTKKGCFLLPAGFEGRVRATLLQRNLALDVVVPKTLPGDIRQEKLLKAQAASLSFQCPDGGVHSRGSFKLPFTVRARSLDGLRLALKGRATTNNATAISLGEFSLDQSRTVPSLDVDTDALPEGTYELVPSLRNTLGQSIPLNETATCKFIVDRTPPSVPALKGWSERLAMGTVLQANVDFPSVLEACDEPWTAESTLSCNGPYKPVLGLHLTQQGKRIVCTRASDPAGNVSPSFCFTSHVIGSKGNLRIKWTKEELNRPPSLLIVPIANLGVAIEWETPPGSGLSREDLQDSLECKVEVRSAIGGMDGYDEVKCLNGRCAGRSLKEWVPCDSMLNISLRDSGGFLAGTFLHVHARLFDGVEYTEAPSLPLGIADTAIKATPTGGVNIRGVVAKHGQVTFFGRGLVLHQSGPSEEAQALMSPDPQIDGLVGPDIFSPGPEKLRRNFFTAVTDAQGRLWLGSSLGVAMWNGSAFQFFDSSNANIPNGITKKLVARKDGTLVLATETDGVHVLRGDSWSPLGSDGGTVPGLKVFDAFETRDGKLLIATATGLFEFDDRGGWKPSLDFIGIVPKTAATIFEAKNGDIWIATENGVSWRHGATLTRFGAETFGPVTTATPYPSSFDEDASGNIWLRHNVGGRYDIHGSAYNTYLGIFDGEAWLEFPLRMQKYSALQHAGCGAIISNLYTLCGSTDLFTISTNRQEGHIFIPGVAERGNTIEAAAVDASGTVWAATSQEGIFTSDGRSWRHRPEFFTAGASDRLKSWKARGTIVAMEYGRSPIEISEAGMQRLIPNVEDSFEIESIAEDGQGRLWIVWNSKKTTHSVGLLEKDRTWIPSVLGHSSLIGWSDFSAEKIKSVQDDGHGIVTFVELDNIVLMSKDGEISKLTLRPDEDFEFSGFHRGRSSGKLYVQLSGVSSSEKKLIVIKGTERVEVSSTFEHLEHASENYMFENSQGQFFYGDEWALAHLQGSTFYSTLPDAQIGYAQPRALFEDAYGEMWFVYQTGLHFAPDFENRFDE